ncbi:MAG: hypothetical protein Q8P91_01515 [bacterium]|nr:hypothetical protein [bacterium]
MVIERGTTGVIKEAEQTAAKQDEIYRRLEDLPIINPVKDDCDALRMTPEEVVNFCLTGEKPEESILQTRISIPEPKEKQIGEWTIDEQITYLGKGLTPGEKTAKEVLKGIKNKVTVVWDGITEGLRAPEA